jgi:hypothetical protein
MIVWANVHRQTESHLQLSAGNTTTSVSLFHQHFGPGFRGCNFRMRAQETYALPILSDRWLVRWEDRFRGLRRSRYGKIQGRPHWLDELQIRRRVRPLGVRIVARESCRLLMHGLHSLTSEDMCCINYINFNKLMVTFILFHDIC